jgi:hypothetical protein
MTDFKKSIMNNNSEKFPLDMSPQSAGCIDMSDEDLVELFFLNPY